MQEIKFISPVPIPTEFTRSIVKEIGEQMCEKYDCELRMMDTPVGEFYMLYNDFSIHEKDTGETLLWGKIECVSFLEEWSLDASENPKKHLGEHVFYIILIRETGEFLKKGGESYYYGILFAFDFFIHILNKMPDVLLETQSYDDKTMFKEFDKGQLIKLRNQFINREDIITSNFY